MIGFGYGFGLFALRTTLAGFGERPVKRSLPNSARGRLAGSLVRGLCPVRPEAYWWQPRKEDFPDFGQGVLSRCLARRIFTVFGRGVLTVAL